LGGVEEVEVGRCRETSRSFIKAWNRILFYEHVGIFFHSQILHMGEFYFNEES
jgi:hypothetical protein